MIVASLIYAGLISVLPADSVVSAEDLAAYEAARATVGRDADSHVKLALWCEAHGLQAERTRHLALAVLNNPAHPTARGLMGLVAFRDRWRRPNAVAEQVKADDALLAALAEYNGRRERTSDTAEAQWKLALWCEEHGLKAEAQAHLAAVVRLDPSREAAWKHLGYKKVNGRWATDAQLEAEKGEAEAQKQADKHWRPLLTKWRGWLGEKEKGRRDQAQRLLSQVDDPRSVPSVVTVFGSSSGEHQAVAVQVLGQIDAPASSRALAFLAIFGRTNEVRRVATESLKGRDAREYADQLIALLRDPIKYEVRPVGGPGSPGALFVQGQRFNVQRLYTPAALPSIPGGGASWLGYDENGLPVLHQIAVTSGTTGRMTGEEILGRLRRPDPVEQQLNQFFAPYVPAGADLFSGRDKVFKVGAEQVSLPANLAKPLEAAVHKVAHDEHKSPSQFGFGLDLVRMRDTQIRIGQMMLEAQKSAITAQIQLQSDVATVEAYNAGVNEGNTRVAQVLKDATGQDLGQDREAWKGWWVDQLGYSYKRPYEQPVPTMVENVPIAYTPQPVLPTTTYQVIATGFQRMSCFGAGTPVRTLLGPQPIESLRVGDQVLTQDLETGELGYKPILVVHHNPPSPTFLIKLDGDTIVSSPFHRFWKSGKGWVMARNLKAGDTLRLLDASATVESAAQGPVQPVYNLDVAEDHDFFAGRRSALVHDNTLPDFRQAPFDADPGLSALVRNSR